MAYYDKIARKWHAATGYHGGAFKRWVLNDLLVSNMPDLTGKAVLELGAGTGYFLAELLQHRAGYVAARVVITDLSTRLLDIARRHFRIEGAEYETLDVRRPFPFGDSQFDLILATMVFNELSDAAVQRAMTEAIRVLRGGGLFLLTVAHPLFVESLDKRGELRRSPNGLWTMPAAGNLRLPVFKRSQARYEALFEQTGFTWEALDVYATQRVLHEKPGLAAARNVPLAMLFRCTKP